MEQIYTLLHGTLQARSRVLVKLNVSTANVDKVIAIIPAMKTPTVSTLWNDGGYAVEAVVEHHTINTLIPALKDAGGEDILELPLSKIVP
jgi:ATP phosphoribosyltransferase